MEKREELMRTCGTGRDWREREGAGMGCEGGEGADVL